MTTLYTPVKAHPTPPKVPSSTVPFVPLPPKTCCFPPSKGPDLSPDAAWWEGVTTNLGKDRADAQRLVTTRLLDRLHDPLAHFSRLQRIYPRAW